MAFAKPSAGVVPYPGDILAPESDLYRVKVNGTPIPVRRETCSGMEQEGGNRTMHSTQFGLSGKATVEVECAKPPTDFRLSPTRFDLKARRNGSRITFELDAFHNLVLTLPGEDPLLLFATPIVKPEMAARNVVVFEESEHDVGDLNLKSNTTYYLAPGALVKGRLHLHDVSNVRITGRGIIDSRDTDGILLDVRDSDNLLIEGIGIRNKRSWQTDFRNSRNVEIRYINLMSFGRNTDGIDLGPGCENFHVHDCFIGCADDGFGWHATDAKNDGERPTRKCRAEDCVIWKARPGNGIRIGSSLETNYLSDLEFKNIDMVHLTRGHAIICDHSDWAEVRRVRFENIRNETEIPFLYMEIGPTRYTNPDGYRPGRIRDIQFVNCWSAGDKVTLKGYDKEHRIEGVLFENTIVGGNRKITSASDLTVNEFVTGLRFS